MQDLHAVEWMSRLSGLTMQLMGCFGTASGALLHKVGADPRSKQPQHGYTVPTPFYWSRWILERAVRSIFWKRCHIRLDQTSLEQTVLG